MGGFETASTARALVVGERADRRRRQRPDARHRDWGSRNEAPLNTTRYEAAFDVGRDSRDA
jgi:hypothetical protein